MKFQPLKFLQTRRAPLTRPTPVTVEPRPALSGQANAVDSAPGRLEADPGRDVDSHAARLLRWLQSDDGLVGDVQAAEVQSAYLEMCAEIGWRPLSWLRVGEALGAICGDRFYRDVRRGGRVHRLRFWRIPRPGESLPPRRVSKRLTDRLERLERANAELVAIVADLRQRLGPSDRMAAVGGH